MKLDCGGRLVVAHSEAAPFAFVGRGRAEMAMHQGNFAIADRLEERVALRFAEQVGAVWHLRRTAGAAPSLSLRVAASADRLVLEVVHAEAGINRVWFRIPAEKAERVWGGGEQMSYLNLRGRRFALWTSEPGVGRDPSVLITHLADMKNHAGGRYDWTNYPQPTFLTSSCVAVHLETTEYSAFDFRDPGFHELECWGVPARIEFFAAATLAGLVGRMAERFGRQPALPEWLYNGAVIGLKSGVSGFARLERFLAAGVKVSALWCEDWAGVRQTSFGTRLFWDWRYSASRYPDLPARIAELRARGIRFMAYASPYVCDDGTLFPEAEALGLLARDAGGGTYRVDFGEFRCGVVDFTQAAARDWFARRILRENMLDIGVSGWMADFGEYLPVDAVLAEGAAMALHNAWPPIWAGVNAQAVEEAGQTGEALFFMRAGFTGTQAVCPMLWAGDQSVDFSRHDGLRTVITGALSAGMLGNAYHHSDIGGYTSVFGNLRTPELIMRWAEMAAFTPMMRTHEGNRPSHNLQIDQDATVLAHFARMTRVWVHLAPYLREIGVQARTLGLPAQRPLFLHFEDDAACFDVEDAYLYGPDLLVAPVHTAERADWNVYLPAGARWVHVWTGRVCDGGARVMVDVPFGQPAVFWREGSPFAALFAGISAAAEGF
jgi:alpha-glucosidase